MALTQERAEARFACFKSGNIFYDFHLSLEKGTNYQGLSEITFELEKIPSQFPLDFKAKELKKLIINNSVVQPKTQEGFILLNVDNLKLGINNVIVIYRSKYDNDGYGLISFVDVDGKQYLYTQLQAYHANKVFALFDQPDLKAKMRLNVICPAQWKRVLSNEYAIIEDTLKEEKYLQTCKTINLNEVKQFINGKSGIMSMFPETKPLPSYLFCIVAGDYQQIKLEKEKQYRNIPMSLYSMESLFQPLQKLAPFLFEITIQSMKFYEQFFGCQYLFNKYDQVFAHQFSSLAMENAGIVTYNDTYLWKQTVSVDKMLDFADTLTHELSHHWFGNLVTMKWWDDLWLNESFADFISYICLEKIKPSLKTFQFESSMLAFHIRKGWGYHEDQRITTHPIRGSVPNTATAQSIFDGITYAKGASTMKQLLFIMQQENFSKALSGYFNKYAFSNATLIDFLAQMQKFIKDQNFNFDEWRKVWLEKASLNLLETKWNHQNKQPNAQLKVIQTFTTPNHPTLRPHKIKIGLFKEDCSVDVIEALINPTEQTCIKYDGSKDYKAILLNYEDYTFAKIQIDKQSLQFFSSHLDKVPDALSRSLIWRSFYDMLKDAKITSKKYLQILCKNIEKEPSDTIVQTQLQYASIALRGYTPMKFRQELYNQIFDFTIAQLQNVDEKNQNRIVILRQFAVSFANNNQNIKKMIDWKNNKFELMKKYELTLTQQWDVVVKAFTLSDLSVQEKEKLYTEQSKIDSSDTSKLKRQTCDALVANKEQFEKIYLSYIDPQNQLSIFMKSASMEGWNHRVHLDWLQSYKQRYFNDIVEVSQKLSIANLRTFVSDLQPIDDDLQSTIQQYKKIKLEGDKYDKINTNIKKAIDDLQRRNRAYKLFFSEQ